MGTEVPATVHVCVYEVMECCERLANVVSDVGDLLDNMRSVGGSDSAGGWEAWVRRMRTDGVEEAMKLTEQLEGRIILDYKETRSVVERIRRGRAGMARAVAEGVRTPVEWRSEVNEVWSVDGGEGVEVEGMERKGAPLPVLGENACLHPECAEDGERECEDRGVV